MSENSSQPAPRPSGEHSGEKHYEQGSGRRNNRSRNNRKRRDRQQEGVDPSAPQVAQRPAGGQPSGQVTVQNGQRPPRDRQDAQRPDFNNNQRRNRPNRPQTNPNARPQDRSEQGTDRPVGSNRPENTGTPNPALRTNNPNQQRQERPKESRNWGRHIKSEDTYEDVRRENERLEKEIWLEIASIHTFKLD